MFEPHLLIAFGTANFAFASEEETGPRYKTWMLDSSRIFPHSTILGTSLRSIVGTESIVLVDGRRGYASTEMENPGRVIPGVSILCVPAWPGVQINPVFIPKIGNLATSTPCQNFNPVLQGGEYMSKIKSAVLLSSGIYQPQTCTLIRSLAKHNPSISLGGGVGELCWTSVNPMPMSEQISFLSEIDAPTEIDAPFGSALFNLLTVGFTVSGDNVCSSTVVLTREMKTQESVENKLLELKESMERGNLRNSFAFMFAGRYRGENFYKGKKNLESGVFNRLFPDTPLIGIYGEGQMGFDTSSIPVHSNQKLDIHLFMRSRYTSIFTIISTLC